MQNDLFSEKKTSDRTSEKSHKSSEGSQKSAKKSWFSKLKPLHYYIGGATLLLVLAVTGFYYLSADLDDSPPSLTLGPAGLRGFIGTGVYVEFNEADILKTADFEDTEEINSGVQYFHYSANSTDKISWKQILSDIKPNDTSLRCVLAQYYPEEKTFKTYPVGPFGGTITVEDDELTSVFVNSGEGAILVCSRAYEMNTENDFLHASVPPAGSLPQLNQMQAGWNLGAVASTEALQSVVASCPQRLRAVWVQDDENSFEKFWAQADRTEVISDRDIRNLELNDDYHMVWFRLSGEPGMCVSTRAEREEAEECDPSRGVTSVSLDKLCTEEGVWIECDRAVLNTLAADGRFICNQNEIWQRCDFSSADSLNRDKNYLCQAPSVWKVCDRRSEGIRSLSGNYECRSGKWTLLTDRPVARPDAVVECGRLGNLSDDRTKVCTSSGYLTCDSSFEGLLSPEGWHECVNGRWVLATVSGAGVCTPGTLNASTTGYCTASSEYLTCDSATAGSKSADGSFECRSGKWVAVMPAGGSANTQLALLVSDVNDWHSEVLALQASAETDLNTATSAETNAQANMDIINSSINTLQGQFNLLTFGGIKDFSFAKFLYANILLASNGGGTTYNKEYFEALLDEIKELRGKANSRMTQLNSSFVSIQAKYNALNAEVAKVGKVKTEIAGASDLTLATSLHAGASVSAGKVRTYEQKIAELRVTLSSLSGEINSIKGQVDGKADTFRVHLGSYAGGGTTPSGSAEPTHGSDCTIKGGYDAQNDLLCHSSSGKWVKCTNESDFLWKTNDAYLCDSDSTAGGDGGKWRECVTSLQGIYAQNSKFLCDKVNDKFIWMGCYSGGITSFTGSANTVYNCANGVWSVVGAGTGGSTTPGATYCNIGQACSSGSSCQTINEYYSALDLICMQNNKWKDCNNTFTSAVLSPNNKYLCNYDSTKTDLGKFTECKADLASGNNPISSSWNNYLCQQEGAQYIWKKCDGSVYSSLLGQNVPYLCKMQPTSADSSPLIQYFWEKNANYSASESAAEVLPEPKADGAGSPLSSAETCTVDNSGTISESDKSKYCFCLDGNAEACGWMSCDDNNVNKLGNFGKFLCYMNGDNYEWKDCYFSVSYFTNQWACGGSGNVWRWKRCNDSNSIGTFWGPSGFDQFVCLDIHEKWVSVSHLQGYYEPVFSWVKCDDGNIAKYFIDDVLKSVNPSGGVDGATRVYSVSDNSGYNCSSNTWTKN